MKKLAPHRIKRIGIVAGISVLILVGALVGLSYWVGYKLAHPQHLPLSSNPAWWGMSFRNVTFTDPGDSLRLTGWWVPHPGSPLTVIISHGYRNNRVGHSVPQLAVARALHQMGANVLLFDFRGSGDSEGHLTSVGIFEQKDLIAADHAVLTRWAPHSKIVLLGYSMGASTALMAAAEDSQVAGVIADSPFADLAQYLNTHLSVWTHLPHYPFTPLVLWLMPKITGVSLNGASPIKLAHQLGKRPVLLIAGSKDTIIPAQNSVALYRQLLVTDPRVTLWMVPWSQHIQAYKVQPIAYVNHLYRFLLRWDPHLKKPGADSIGFYP